MVALHVCQVWWTLACKPLRTRRHKSRRTLCQGRSVRACVHSVGMLCGYMPNSSCMWMTHKPNAISILGSIECCRGGTVYIYCFRSLFEAKPVPPPDTKFWLRHWFNVYFKITSTDCSLSSPLSGQLRSRYLSSQRSLSKFGLPHELLRQLRSPRACIARVVNRISSL